MRTEDGVLKGDQRITDDFRLDGIIGGNATVEAGHFDLHGMVTGDLHVAAGATADVYGMVDGDILNSGTVTIHGMVKGTVVDQGGETIRQPKSVIGGVEQP